jgi:hypothetical protein
MTQFVTIFSTVNKFTNGKKTLSGAILTVVGGFLWYYNKEVDLDSALCLGFGICSFISGLIHKFFKHKNRVADSPKK